MKMQVTIEYEGDVVVTVEQDAPEDAKMAAVMTAMREIPGIRKFEIKNVVEFPNAPESIVDTAPDNVQAQDDDAHEG